MQTKPNVIHWSEEQPPEENNLRERLAQENLKAYTWGNRPNDIYAAHRHDYHKVIYVISGSITFDLSELQMKITLNAGDRLETRHFRPGEKCKGQKGRPPGYSAIWRS